MFTSQCRALRQMLTWFSLLAVLGACDGANMAGSNKRKDKTEKSENTDASTPYVITGAYLTCQPSPKDSESNDIDSVGCNLTKNNQVISATEQNKLSFHRVLPNGSYQAPNKKNSSSGHQAVFFTPKSESSKTEYKAVFAHTYGMQEVTCKSLPCEEKVPSIPDPTHLSFPAAAIWSMDPTFVNTINKMPEYNYIDPSFYCVKGKPEIGRNPGNDYVTAVAAAVLGIPIPRGTPLSIPIGNNKIESSQRLYASIANFKKHRLNRGPKNKEPPFFYYDYTGSQTSVNLDDDEAGCAVISLKKSKTSVPDFPVDGMSRRGAMVKTDRFHLIVPFTAETKDSVLRTIDAFLDDVSE